MKLSTNKYSILESGSAVISNSEYYRIEIDSKLIVQLHFITDESKGQTIETSLENGDHLKVLIYNIKGLGASAQPLIIAEDDVTRKKVLLNLAFQKYDNAILCHYTFMIEK